MNALDATLQRSFPSVMVARSEPVGALVDNGERLLIAANGIFLEIVRPWLRVVRRVARYEVATAIPYGDVVEVTELRCGTIPADLIGQFFVATRAALPNETGAWIVWHPVTGRFRLVELPVLSHSADHLQYERPELEDGECLVVDCHSHGREEAFFSRTDNADDQHDVKLALVLGECHREPSTALRLCAKGLFERLEAVPVSWVAALKGEVLQ